MVHLAARISQFGVFLPQTIETAQWYLKIYISWCYERGIFNKMHHTTLHVFVIHLKKRWKREHSSTLHKSYLFKLLFGWRDYDRAKRQLSLLCICINRYQKLHCIYLNKFDQEPADPSLGFSKVISFVANFLLNTMKFGFIYATFPTPLVTWLESHLLENTFIY